MGETEIERKVVRHRKREKAIKSNFKKKKIYICIYRDTDKDVEKLSKIERETNRKKHKE